MAEPVIGKVTNTLDTVQRITVNVGEKADSILTKGEALTDYRDGESRVRRQTVVQESGHDAALINLSSLITGLSTGLSVWSRAATDGEKEQSPAWRCNPQ